MADSHYGLDRATTGHLMVLAETVPALREGIQAYLTLWRLHHDLHPAVIFAILTRPPGERRGLLDAVNSFQTSRPDPEGQGVSPSKSVVSRQSSSRRGTSMDSDDVWEDALEESFAQQSFTEDDDTGHETTTVFGDCYSASGERESPKAGRRSPLDSREAEGACEPPARENPAPQEKISEAAPRKLAGKLSMNVIRQLTEVENAAERCREAWRATRDLEQWERYLQLRRYIAEIRKKLGLPPRPGQSVIGDEQPPRVRPQPRPGMNTELARLREQHECRLQELHRRRQRLEWAQQYQEQRMQVQMIEQRRHLEEELQRLDRERETRRSRNQQRIRELQLQLQEDIPTPAPKAHRNTHQVEDVFTHVWDDIQMWEHIISSPEADKRPRPLRSIENRQHPAPENRPPASLIAMPAPSTVAANKNSQGVAKGKKDGYQQRKKWFEEALLAWQAPDDTVPGSATTWLNAEQPWTAWHSTAQHSHLRL